MKKLFYSLLFLAGFALFSTSNANAQAYDVGTNVINAGVGFGYWVGYGLGSATPVISVSFEHGLMELGPGKLGIGGAIGFQGNTYKGPGYKQRWSTFLIGARGTWHPDVLVGDNYDVYGGLQLSYYNYSYSYDGPGGSNYSNPLNSTVGLGLIVGGRYYFTENIGAFAELGYDIAYFKIGLAAKF